MYPAAGRNRANVSIVVRVGGSNGPPDIGQICEPRALHGPQLRRGRRGKSSGFAFRRGGIGVVSRCPRRVAKRQRGEIRENRDSGAEGDSIAAKWLQNRRNQARWV